VWSFIPDLEDWLGLLDMEGCYFGLLLDLHGLLHPIQLILYLVPERRVLNRHLLNRSKLGVVLAVFPQAFGWVPDEMRRMEFFLDNEGFFRGELLREDNLQHLVRVVFEVLSSGVAEQGAVSGQREVQSGIDESQTILLLPESDKGYIEGFVGILGNEYDLSFILIK
jgi:hypothetical protein